MTRYREAAGIGGDPRLVYEYTTSISHDSEIYPYVIRVLIAHTVHLSERGLIPRDAACSTLRSLLEALKSGPGAVLKPGYEDVFEAVEDWLDTRTGGASRYVWLGRSRNDHVSAALRLYTLEKLTDTLAWIAQARRWLLELADRYRGTPVVLHTHQQPSQVAALECLIMAWEEGLASAFQLLHSVTSLVDRSPLGAGAGAGTVADIDPARLAELAGFTGVVGSSVYATGSRLDVTAASLAAAAALIEASRIAGDLIALSSPYVGAARLPDSHVATSSIMPHKRNPVTLEVLRARAARAAGLASGLLSIQKGLPYGYNLDLQEANPVIYEILSDTLESFRVLADLFSKLEFDVERLRVLAERYTAWGAELAELLATRIGKPLREAYREAAAAIREGRAGELLERLGVRDPTELALMRRTGCNPGPDPAPAKERLARDEQSLDRLARRAKNAPANLLEKAEQTLKECQP